MDRGDPLLRATAEPKPEPEPKKAAPADGGVAVPEGAEQQSQSVDAVADGAQHVTQNLSVLPEEEFPQEAASQEAASQEISSEQPPPPEAMAEPVVQVPDGATSWPEYLNSAMEYDGVASPGGEHIAAVPESASTFDAVQAEFTQEGFAAEPESFAEPPAAVRDEQPASAPEPTFVVPYPETQEPDYVSERSAAVSHEPNVSPPEPVFVAPYEQAAPPEAEPLQVPHIGAAEPPEVELAVPDWRSDVMPDATPSGADTEIAFAPRWESIPVETPPGENAPYRQPDVQPATMAAHVASMEQWAPAVIAPLPSPAQRGGYDRPTAKSIGVRGAKVAAIVFSAWFGLVLFLIVAYRFVNPPFSTLMAVQWIGGTTINQQWVPLEAMSPNLMRAVIASEDGRFCSHWGIDFAEMAAAIRRAPGGTPRGASTITMQVAKNLFLWPAKSYVRKVIEVPLTYAIELFWPKRRILEVYLNIAEWGPGIFGAEAASQAHFGRSAEELSPRQGAQLAVALPNPFTRDPGDPGPWASRRASLIQRLAARAPEEARCVVGADD